MKEKRHKTHLRLVIVLLFSVVFYSCKNTYQNPKKGYIYLVPLDSLSYTTWKITQVKTKKIWYVQNDYTVSDSLFADSINSPKNYSDFPKIILRKEFKKKLFTLITPKNK